MKPYQFRILSSEAQLKSKSNKRPIRLPSVVAEEKLCVRCGFCFDICPLGLVGHDNLFFPQIKAEDLQKCTACGLCIRGCAADVDFSGLSLAIFGKRTGSRDVEGVIEKVYVGYSKDPEVRTCGSSGGVVSELLLHLLRTKEIEQALVCGMNEHRPWEPRPFLARSRKEIIDSAQSKYTIVPQMRRLAEILKSKKRTGIVALPCQIHAYRKFAEWYPKIKTSVPLVIGLACHSTLEIEASQKLLEKSRIHFNAIAKLEYRGGRWPGGIRVILKSGKVRKLHNLDIKTAFNRLSPLYTPDRCLTCIDHTAELSDLSVMDPWIRDESGRHPYHGGFSMIIARNTTGIRVLEEAVKADCLYLKEISRSFLPTQFTPMVNKKKIGAPIRIEKLKRAGAPFPKYNLEFSPPTFKEGLLEKMDEMRRFPSKNRTLRELCVRLLFSPFGDFLIRMKDAAKVRRFNASKFF